MSILLVNDDGLRSPGIKAARNVLTDFDDVYTVVPDRERSGASHSITLSYPLQLHEVEEQVYECSGTPADCVKIGLRDVMEDERPDLIVSGINPGGNIGSAIHYSGTVAAAAEAAIMGFPSIAISITSHNPTSYRAASEFLKNIVPKIIENGLPKWVLLNVNVPDLPSDNIKGARLVPQGLTFYDDYFEQYVDHHGKKHYWMVGDIKSSDDRPDNDLIAIDQGYIAVTPVYLEVTAHKHLKHFEGWGIKDVWQKL
ncbi:MAG: 5'/3'-nucleotidase SurE [Candidatus Zixiibacteriota bacterium]